ncbi:MAG: hypothetical protein ISP91_06370 [Pseudomonadales bacterium]|nr:hypothetical protein [Pseudomonadales bacterium]
MLVSDCVSSRRNWRISLNPDFSGTRREPMFRFNDPESIHAVIAFKVDGEEFRFEVFQRYRQATINPAHDLWVIIETMKTTHV